MLSMRLTAVSSLWSASTLATWCKEATHWKRPWCYERLRAGGGGGNRGWDGWMASLTQRPWVWVNSRSWWRTGKLVCCYSWGRKEMDMTSWVNNNGGHGCMWCGFLALRPNLALHISLTHSSFYCFYQILNALTSGIWKALPSTQITHNLLPLFFSILYSIYTFLERIS